MKTSQKKGITKLIFKHTPTMEHFFTKKVAFPFRSVVLACALFYTSILLELYFTKKVIFPFEASDLYLNNFLCVGCYIT